MLEKRHVQDDILLVKDAISDLIDVLALRKEEEAQGTPQDGQANNGHTPNTGAKGGGMVRFEKRIHEMINHLTSLNQMNLPNLSTKNLISNEKNFLLSSKS